MTTFDLKPGSTIPSTGFVTHIFGISGHPAITVKIATDDLAALVASSFTNFGTSPATISAKSWADLVAMTPTMVNQMALVSLNDTGTHTGRTAASPGADVGSVPNSGVYGAYGTGVGQWRRDGDVIASVDELADAISAIQNNGQPGGAAIMDTYSRVVSRWGIGTSGGYWSYNCEIDPYNPGDFTARDTNRRSFYSFGAGGGQVGPAVFWDASGNIRYNGVKSYMVEANDTGEDPLIAGEITLTSDAGGVPMELPFHPRSMLESKVDASELYVSIARRPASAGAADAWQPWQVVTREQTVPLRYGFASGTLDIGYHNGKNAKGSGYKKYDMTRYSLKVNNLTVPKVATVRPMFIGDSITENSTVHRATTWLTRWGLTVVPIGTYNSRQNYQSVASITGGKCEGRGGSRLDEHFGLQLYGDTTNVQLVASGQEATYLALPDRTGSPNKKQFAPMAKNWVSGTDPANCNWNGKTIDIANYVTRFQSAWGGGGGPTQFICNLYTNDYSQSIRPNYFSELNVAPATVAAWKTGWRALYYCLRRYSATAPIHWWCVQRGWNELGMLAWPAARQMIRSMIELYVELSATDSNLHLVPCHLFHNDHMGYAWPDVETVNSLTGGTYSRVGDSVHPNYHNLELHAIALAANIAYYA